MSVDGERTTQGEGVPCEQPKALPPTVQVRVSWGESTIDVAHLEPPRALTWGELAHACEPGALGATVATKSETTLLELDEDGWPCVVLPENVRVRTEPVSVAERIEQGALLTLPSGASGLRLAEGDRARVTLGGVDVLFFAVDPCPATKPERPRLDRRTKWVAVSVLAAHAAAFALLAGTSDRNPSREPDAEQIAEMQRLFKISSDEEIEAGGKEGGTGTRAKGEEGGMSSKRYGVRGPAEVDPHIARQQALRDSQEFGMIGLLDSGAGGDPNAPTAPWGRDQARGNMWGDSIGDARGASGLGLSGVGTIGHGAGTGTGQGFGNGAGRLAGRHQAPSQKAPWPSPSYSSADPLAVTPQKKAPIDPNGRFATTYRPGQGHLASFEAALARGVLPPEARDVIADVGASAPTSLAAPTDVALAWRTDLERAQPAPGGGPTHLRISLRSAEKSAGRPHLSVHLVMDTSGSMSGEAIVAAKDAAKQLVGRLAPTDDFSLVTFSSGAEVKVADGPVGPRRAKIVRAIDGLVADGGTNISEGLVLGYQQAHTSTIPSEALRVVLLMSDGKPNGGMSNQEDLSRLALGAFQDGVQTSAFGLGTDYDGPLMSSIAADGAGGYYYVSRPDQIAQALSTELDRRLDPVALGVEVRVRLKDDVKLLGVYGSRRLGESEAAKVRAQEASVDVQAAAQKKIARDRKDDTEGGMRFFMPAFGRDDAHSILLQLDLPPGSGERGIASVEVKYKDLFRHTNAVDERKVQARWADSDAASVATVDRSMQRSIQSFASGEALSQAALAVQRGDFGGALAVLDERTGILEQAAVTIGDPSIAVDAARLAKLRAFIDPSGRPSDRLALAMLVETAGQTRLR
jgi:Ca-activated chloride channel family protein